jgi:hypothetical protein
MLRFTFKIFVNIQNFCTFAKNNKIYLIYNENVHNTSF